MSAKAAAVKRRAKKQRKVVRELMQLIVDCSTETLAAKADDCRAKGDSIGESFFYTLAHVSIEARHRIAARLVERHC